MLQKIAEQNKELVEEDEELGNVAMDATYGKDTVQSGAPCRRDGTSHRQDKRRS